MAQHLTHYCDCGNIIHWPKSRNIGDVWVCRYCKTEWTLSTEGQPGDLMDTVGKGVAFNPDYHPAPEVDVTLPTPIGDSQLLSESDSSGSSGNTSKRSKKKGSIWGELMKASKMFSKATEKGGSYEFTDEAGLYHRVEARRTTSGFTITETTHTQESKEMLDALMKDLKD